MQTTAMLWKQETLDDVERAMQPIVALALF